MGIRRNGNVIPVSEKTGEKERQIREETVMRKAALCGIF